MEEGTVTTTFNYGRAHRKDGRGDRVQGRVIQSAGGRTSFFDAPAALVGQDCACCPAPIRKGDRVAWWVKSEGRAAHERCVKALA
jgi:uncharacterized Zn-binding protein involved in type VI secretion